MMYAHAAPERYVDLTEPVGKALRPPGTLTVLLAEDDQDLRYVMECSLIQMGYAVVACADAHLASRAFRSSGRIDILITDFDMPGRTGLELARDLTEIDSGLPVIFVTGSVLPDATMQEIHTRQWLYVSKPCYVPSLERTISAILNHQLAA